MAYYPMHMHLHSVHQPGASMEGHIYNAHALGMKYIRFTEHDTRTGKKEFPVESFDFSRGALFYEDAPGQTVALDMLGEPKAEFEGGSLILTGEGGVRLRSSGKRHSASLLAEIEITLGIFAEGAIIDLTLSQRPPDFSEAHLCYAIGDARAEEHVHSALIRLEPRADGIYRLNISRDAAEHEEIGGLDNALCTISVLTDGTRVELFKLELGTKYGFDEVVRRQRALADKIGARYGIKPFVTTEISGAGRHKNVYSEAVPIIDYEKLGFQVSEEEAIAHVVRHGGIFCYNHPFEKYKRLELTPREVDAIAKSEAEAMIKCRALGATLLEVGFTEGRGRFTLAHHLELWDLLSLSGIFISGDGDSDSHHCNRGWFSGNNFATYIFAPSELPHPIAESEFIRSMKAGNLYAQDPTVPLGRLVFSSGKCPMGSVIRSNKKSHPVSLFLDGMKRGYTVRLIDSGSCAAKRVCEADGAFMLEYECVPSGKVSFVRAEVYNAENRCVLITNPIYFVDGEFCGEIPSERLVNL